MRRKRVKKPIFQSSTEPKPDSDSEGVEGHPDNGKDILSKPGEKSHIEEEKVSSSSRKILNPQPYKQCRYPLRSSSTSDLGQERNISHISPNLKSCSSNQGQRPIRESSRLVKQLEGKGPLPTSSKKNTKAEKGKPECQVDESDLQYQTPPHLNTQPSIKRQFGFKRGICRTRKPSTLRSSQSAIKVSKKDGVEKILSEDGRQKLVLDSRRISTSNTEDDKQGQSIESISKSNSKDTGSLRGISRKCGTTETTAKVKEQGHAEDTKKIEIIDLAGEEDEPQVAREVEKVLGITIESGRTKVWISFKGSHGISFVNVNVARRKFGNLLIEYYKKRLLKFQDAPTVAGQNGAAISLEDINASQPEIIVEPSDGDFGTGFDKGLEAEKILSSRKNSSGEMMYLIKWKDSSEPPSYMRAEDAITNNSRAQIFIDYIEPKVISKIAYAKR